ncbi:helix-turn-helix transcriptional regulator [Lentilactobacillus sp. SPB1-3]|uniref:Helix-turn-helix transcriptional regulator n=1 Tax=Lentilactobacillus terminaliae TaxID=3003483 RepID=A0ACD5DG14_9LACO|nr:helix-turn-helix transcriptional regulator [Lentilactobacillus sp. SPB1-3]MCZ0976417.1 helix-turn-helix transcriptional regulator [Lentilactobacillus sp. SPB1-3]
MINSLSVKLKEARLNHGYSQNEVSTILHISRQSISKWENGRTYPDIDNLLMLSDLYEISLDDLMKSDESIKANYANNNQEIIDKRRTQTRVNDELYQNSNEGLMLVVLSLVSAIVPPIGVILPIYVMWRNTKYNSLYKMIYLISIVVMLVSLWGTWIIISDNLLPSHTEVYRIN